jgi:GT2 family glycosyltransferase
MKDEIDVTIQTVETLLESIEDDITISILFNGGNSSELRELFAGFNCIKYYESQQNLGVAGGRNFLLRTVECKNSDIVFFLDNDVVPPLDYVRNLSTFLVHQQDAGVVGAIVADIRKIPYRLVKSSFGDRGVFGNRLFKMSSASIKDLLINELSPEHLFHIGIHADYRLSYFSLRPLLFYKIMRFVFSLLRMNKNFSPILKNNTACLSLIEDGISHYRVSNIAGCSQAFKRQLVEEIGGLNDLFNPYGFEDAEFCARSINAGYNNYIDTNTWLYHGTDTRHRERDPDMSCENQFRGLTIFASIIFSNPLRYRVVILKIIVFEFLLEMLQYPAMAKRRLKCKLAGYRKTLKSLETK